MADNIMNPYKTEIINVRNEQHFQSKNDANLERLLLASPQNFFESMFTCAFCANIVKNAWFLSCLHSFCIECIKSKTQINNLIKCPLCPNFSDTYRIALKSNLLPGIIDCLKQLQNKIQKGIEYNCTDCLLGVTTMATSYCLQCGSFICDVEVRAHRKYYMENHNIIELSMLKEFSVTEIIINLATDLQATTSKKIDDDQKFVSKSTINELIVTAVQKLAEIEAIKIAIEKQWTDKKINISDQFEQLLSSIAQSKLALIREVDEGYKNLLLPHENSILQLTSIIDYCKHLSELSRYPSICEVSDQLNSQIRLVERILINLTPTKSAYDITLKNNSQITLKAISQFIECNIVLNENQLLLGTELKPIHYFCQDKISAILRPSDMAIKGDFIYLLFRDFITINCCSNKILNTKNEIMLPISSGALSFIIDNEDRFTVITLTNIMLLSVNSAILNNNEHKLQLENSEYIKLCESQQINFVYLLSSGQLLHLNILDSKSKNININGYTADTGNTLVILDVCHQRDLPNSLIVLARVAPSHRSIRKEKAFFDPPSTTKIIHNNNLINIGFPVRNYKYMNPEINTNDSKQTVIFILDSNTFNLIRKINLACVGDGSFIQSAVNGVWLIDVGNEKSYLYDFKDTKSNQFQQSNSVLFEKLCYEDDYIKNSSALNSINRSYNLNDGNHMLYLNRGLISFLEIS